MLKFLLYMIVVTYLLSKFFFNFISLLNIVQKYVKYQHFLFYIYYVTFFFFKYNISSDLLITFLVTQLFVLSTIRYVPTKFYPVELGGISFHACP